MSSFRFPHISDDDQVSGDLGIKQKVVTGFESKSWSPSVPQGSKFGKLDRKSYTDGLTLSKQNKTLFFLDVLK